LDECAFDLSNADGLAVIALFPAIDIGSSKGPSPGVFNGLAVVVSAPKVFASILPLMLRILCGLVLGNDDSREAGALEEALLVNLVKFGIGLSPPPITTPPFRFVMIGISGLNLDSISSIEAFGFCIAELYPVAYFLGLILCLIGFGTELFQSAKIFRAVVFNCKVRSTIAGQSSKELDSRRLQCNAFLQL
jgi:hypothetical protein